MYSPKVRLLHQKPTPSFKSRYGANFPVDIWLLSKPQKPVLFYDLVETSFSIKIERSVTANKIKGEGNWIDPATST